MKKEISETIEFFIPSQGLDVRAYIDQPNPPEINTKAGRLRKQAIHHLGRYEWAALVLSNMNPGRILDVACGAGYGSYLLARSLPECQVVGGDYDIRAVEHATENYGHLPNLTFRQLDIVTWTEGSDGTPISSFDYIVSFDTIEHLLHREIALINLCENLPDEGMLLFSTPCGKKENLLNPGWEHHKIEYSHRYLFNLMKRFFQKVMIPDNGSLPELAYWHDVINKGEQRYFLRGNPMVCTGPIRLGLDWPAGTS